MSGAGTSTRKTALVTGGAKGIGLAITARLVRAGVDVMIFDIDADAAEEVVARFSVHSHQVDVTDPEAVKRAVDDAGPFDILVNNAGVDQHSFFLKTGFDEMRRLIAINLESVLIVTQAVLPGMHRAGSGRIVNVASEAGRLGSKGGSVYAAAKAGVIGFTKSIARESARYGVTANVVAPGPIDTPMLRDALATAGGALEAAMIQSTLLNRLGTPDEVAAAVCFLASDDARYITGEVIGVSGGMYAAG